MNSGYHSHMKQRNYGNITVGLDEVGRGPLAGAVVAAAVVLSDAKPIEGLRDSKKLSAKKREQLYALITQRASAWAVGRAEVEEIDRLNIHHASLLAMQRAYQALKIDVEQALVDGKFCPDIDCPALAVVKGDQLHDCISAASIVAKVTRDREMQTWHQHYPEYGFNQHMGYGTKAHIAALNHYGVCNIHRRSFAPVKNLL